MSISVGPREGAVTMPFVIFPFSDVRTSVGALVGAVAMRFTIFPFSDVRTSVGPRVGAVAMHFASLPLSDVLISVGPRAGAVAMRFTIFQCSSVHVPVDVLEAALAFGVEGAEEQAQEHRYKTDPIGEKNNDATESDSCCICNESDSGPLVGAVAVGKEHRYKRYTKYTRSGEERKFMTNRKCFVLHFLRQP